MPASRRCSVCALVMSLPSSTTRAAARPAHPHDRLDQLGLPVALDAGDAEHLARVHHQVDPGQQRPAAALAGQLQPGHLAAPPGR